MVYKGILMGRRRIFIGKGIGKQVLPLNLNLCQCEVTPFAICRHYGNFNISDNFPLCIELLLSKYIFSFESTQMNPFFILHCKFTFHFELLCDTGIHLITCYKNRIYRNFLIQTNDYFEWQ